MGGAVGGRAGCENEEREERRRAFARHAHKDCPSHANIDLSATRVS